MFGRKKSAPPISDVLVPLYVYPSVGAWALLFTQIINHPALNFTVIVNPASGPGSSSTPDANYTREIPRLNAYANVRTVGYVSTAYAERDLEAILRDIDVYSAWPEVATADLGVQGIFLDETPAQYNDASADSLETIAAHVKSAAGFGRNPLVIHNPGTIPDARYMDLCDLSVLFEGTYSTYQNYGFDKIISSFRAANDIYREATAVVMHGLPPTLSSIDQESLVNQARRIVGSVFMTGLANDYYVSFWEGWAGFVEDMDG